MWQVYAPEERQRLNLGIRRRLAPLLDNDRQLIELANSLLFTLPGAPIIYYGDEIGMGDNIWLPDRNGVRTPMQWSATRSAGFSTSEQLYSPVIDQPPFGYQTLNVAAQRADLNSLWHAIRRMIRLCKEHPALSEGDLTWVNCGTQSVLAFRRTTAQESLLAVHNLSQEAQDISIDVPALKPAYKDLLTGAVFAPRNNKLSLSLVPHQYLWLE